MALLWGNSPDPGFAIAVNLRAVERNRFAVGSAAVSRASPRPAFPSFSAPPLTELLRRTILGLIVGLIAIGSHCSPSFSRRIKWRPFPSYSISIKAKAVPTPRLPFNRLYGKVPTTAGGDGGDHSGHFPIKPSSFSCLRSLVTLGA